MNDNTRIKVRFGIFGRLLGTLLLVSLIPLLIVWYLNYTATVAQLNRQVDESLYTVLEKLTGYVDGWVEMNYRMLLQNAAVPEVRSMAVEQQNPVLRSITDQYPWAYLAFTVATDGNNIGRSDGKPPKYYGDRGYVQEVLAGAPLSQQVLIGKTSGKPSFVMSAPISAGSTTAGVIAIAMTIAEMSKQVIQSSIGETGHAFLVDRDGKVIAHQSEQFIKSRHDLSTNPAILASKWGENRLVYTNEDGKKIIAFTLQTERGWTMVVEQEYEEAFAALTQLNHRTVLLLVATVIPVVLITFMLSRSFSVPIRKLTEITNAISMGDLKVRIREVSRGDEIGVLAGAIDRLRTSTELAMGRLKQ